MAKSKLVQTIARSLFPAAAPSLLILLLLASSPPRIDAQEDCDYEYLRQPPTSLLGMCNPYETSATLIVQCQISAQVHEGVAVEIQWYYNDEQITDDSFPPLSSIEETVSGVDENIRTSVLTIGGNEFDDSYVGDYHCQIVVNGNFTAPSQSLTLDTEDTLIFSNPCNRNNVHAVEVTKCAGRATIPPPLPSTTQPDNTDTSSMDSSLTPSTTLATPMPSPTPGAGGTVTSTRPNLGSTEEPMGETLQVWVYVLVAIAAVFGMIIVVLTILCVGLCLKKNKTEDTYKQKGVEIQQFTSNSMISNGLYQRKDEGGITSGTHISSHSQISDYNTLEGRDYEEIDMGEDKHDYHHLQRPSPPLHVNNRSHTFQVPPTTEFHSMSTLTSQMGNIPMRERELLQQQQVNTLPIQGSRIDPENHVYRELEQATSLNPGPSRPGGVKDIYRSPTNSDSPDSAQLFGGRGTMPTATTDTGVFGYPNESLYSPTFELPQSARVQKGGLENVPETGTMFSEPVNPTAFPVHNYEKILNGPEPQYEKPVVTRKKASSISTMPPPAAQSNSTGTRPRTNSNASTRYETELPQAHHDSSECQYSKLVRPVEPPSTIPEGLDPSNNSIASPFYAELGSSLPGEAAARPPLDKGAFSHSSAELSRQGGKAYPGKVERGFTVPASQVSTTGYNMVNRGPSVSSTTDSLSSYITRLQENDENDKPMTDLQLDGILFNETRSQPVPEMEETQFQRSGCRRNASFEVRGRPRGQRAWSEERRDVGGYSDLATSKSGFSGSAMDGRSFNHGLHSMSATKMHRDLRVNGCDPRLGEYARTKTMV